MSAAGEVLRQSFTESQLHVLAVDDSVTDRKVIERLLKVSSFKVTAVDSGTRALQFLGLDGQKDSAAGYDGLKVNLIMTDYSMPGMSGYELLKKIKESSALKEIPVVIMSSEKIITRIDRCLQEGAEEFIVKPVKLSDVKRLKDFVMRVEVEENSENDKWKRLEEEEGNREGTIMYKRKSQEGNSLLPCSPQSSLLLRGSDPVSPQQPSSIPQCCCKQPRLCSID